jgi:hypothetical protein
MGGGAESHNTFLFLGLLNFSVARIQGVSLKLVGLSSFLPHIFCFGSCENLHNSAGSGEGCVAVADNLRALTCLTPLLGGFFS